jgi:hypothetical protein
MPYRPTVNPRLTLNPHFDADPSQRRFAPLFRAGQAERWAPERHTHPKNQ